jgi:hypothetical protein
MSNRIRRACAVAGIAIVAASTGCGRTVTAVDLDPLVFAHEDAPVPGAIELCLTRALRMRQWNVRNHPYLIELGDRAALNVERLAKAAFDSVVVSFEEPCGQETNRPWLSAKILAANREADSLWARNQETTITLDFELVSDAGTQIWETRVRGSVTKKPAALTRRKIRAAEDFGEAMQQALDEAFREIVESEAIRRALAS